ncbi:hypothetical protein [Vibrio phage VP16T]|nr:hypothetical protein [Vibrio phage VP16T]
MNVIERLTEFANNVKVAMGVGIGTASGGVGQVLDLLPDNVLTKSATLVGMCLSLVLIYTHLKRHLREERAAKVDLQIKLKQLNSDKAPD